MQAFSDYGHTLVSMAVLVLLWAAMGPISAVAKERAGAAPGGDLPADYANPAYRWQRAYANLTETMPFFLAAALSAMLAGASAFWVDIAAALFLFSRIAVAVVHVRGIGKPSGGLRSILFTLGWAMCILLALLAIFAAF